MVVDGTISNIVDFGAFVDLDGIDGLIHISELSWSHVNHPSEILSIGDTVNVKVLDIDRDRQRISLGLKQTQEDPWQRVVDTYNVGDELEGKVTKVVTFGAFVEILDGVEGLVHISELAQHHVENPREIIQPGDEVKVKILEIDSERRRLSLSIKRVEGQVLPLRQPDVAGEDGDAEQAGVEASLDDVPELGLSEDVFAGGSEDGGRGRGGAGGRGGRARGRAPPPRSRRRPSLRPPRRPSRPRRPSPSPRPRPSRPRRPSPSPRPRPSRPRRPSPSPRRPVTASSRPRPRTRRRRPDRLSREHRVPFVGLTGGIAAGKSTALAALARLGAATLSTDAVVHELYAERRDARPRRRALGRGGRAGRRRRPRGDRRARVRGARGARVAGGRAVAARRRARARLSRGRRTSWSRRRPPRWSRRRCCSRPAWRPPTTRRSRSSRPRSCARRAPAARGHAAVAERTARQLSQEEKAARATYAVVNDGSVEQLEARLSEVLAKLGR